MKSTFVIIITFFLTVSCKESGQLNLEAEKEKILQLHKLQREYHFNKDSISFANQLSENFISVNRGQITFPTNNELVSRYHNYFSSVEFVKWDDVSDPIIRFSEDGKLAYTIVDKVVTVRYESENGDLIEDESQFAWIAIYKKYGDEWKIDCVTSTESQQE